jgi:hypothetical protein
MVVTHTHPVGINSQWKVTIPKKDVLSLMQKIFISCTRLTKALFKKNSAFLKLYIQKHNINYSANCDWYKSA